MKNFKQITHYIFALSLVFFGFNAIALEQLEDAIETESLRITLQEDGTGFVQGKLCDSCKLLTIPVSADTKAFDSGVLVPLKNAVQQSGRLATIFTDLEHKTVLRISW